MIRRKLTFIGAAALAAVSLATACSSPAAPDGEGTDAEPLEPPRKVEAHVERGIPEGWEVDQFSDEPAVEQTLAAWVEEGESFAVVTWGSSSCPPVADTLQLISSGELRLVFGPPVQQICTADMAPTTHTLTLPDAASDRPISLTVVFEEYDETVELSLD